MNALLSRFVFLLLGVAFGGVASLTVLSKSNLVVCRSDYQQLAVKYQDMQGDCGREFIANVLLTAILRSPPAGSRVSIPRGWNSIGGTARNESDGRGLGYWSFQLDPAPTRDSWPSVAESIKRSLADDPFVRSLTGGFGFKIVDVEWRGDNQSAQEGNVSVAFMFNLEKGVLSPPEPAPGGILKDLFLSGSSLN